MHLKKEIVRKLLSVIAILLFVYLVLYVFFIQKINEISCFNQYDKCSDDLASMLDQIKGKSIYSVKNNVRKILKEKKYEDRYGIKSGIGKIFVYVIERKPYAAYKLGDNYYLYDKKGFFMGKNKSTDTIYLEADAAFAKNPKFNPLKLLYYLNLLYGVKSGSVDSETVTFRLLGYERVIFPIDKEPKIMVSKFRYLESFLGNEIKKIAVEKGKDRITIDLGLERPIIKYE